jgi:hypothetical protein
MIDTNGCSSQLQAPTSSQVDKLLNLAVAVGSSAAAAPPPSGQGFTLAAGMQPQRRYQDSRQLLATCLSLEQLVKAIQTAATALLAQLGGSFFMSFSLACLACLARIRVSLLSPSKLSGIKC